MATGQPTGQPEDNGNDRASSGPGDASDRFYAPPYMLFEVSWTDEDGVSYVGFTTNLLDYQTCLLLGMRREYYGFFDTFKQLDCAKIMRIRVARKNARDYFRTNPNEVCLQEDALWWVTANGVLDITDEELRTVRTFGLHSVFMTLTKRTIATGQEVTEELATNPEKAELYMNNLDATLKAAGLSAKGLNEIKIPAMPRTPGST